MQPCPHRSASEPSRWTEDGVCSSCGSLSPKRFFAAIEKGTQLLPTDNPYKSIVDGLGKICYAHLSDKEQDRFVQLMNDRKVKYGPPGWLYILPYFVRMESEDDGA